MVKIFSAFLPRILNFIGVAEADPNNLLGFNHREARLAERVREMEEQNQLLRRQLSFSQSQLINAMTENRRNDSTAAQDVITSYGSNGGGEEKSIVKCPSKVRTTLLLKQILWTRIISQK
jgi:hypothetical protein